MSNGKRPDQGTHWTLWDWVYGGGTAQTGRKV